MSFYNHSGFSPFAGDIYYLSPYEVRRQQQILQRERELQALKRAEMERERQYREQQEAERLRWLRRQEDEEERQRQLLKRKQLQQKHMQEKALLRQQRVQEEALLRQRRQRQQEEDDGNKTDLKSPTIVRGSDGQPYSLIPLSSRPRRLENVVRGSDGKLYKLVPYQDDTSDEEHASPNLQNQIPHQTASKEKKVQKPPSSKLFCESMDLDEEEPSQRRRAGKRNGKKKKRVTIVVEDASDSEYEDDEINAYWRNRKPSEGQWIEPVEGV